MAKFDLDFFKKFDAEELEEIIIAYEYHRDSYGEVFDAVRAEMEYENERDDDYDEDERFEDSGEDVETIEQNRTDYFAETSSALDLGTAMGHDSIFYDVEEIIQRELNNLYRDIDYNEDHVYSEINRLFNASIDKLKQLQKEKGSEKRIKSGTFSPTDEFDKIFKYDMTKEDMRDFYQALRDLREFLVSITGEISRDYKNGDFDFGVATYEASYEDAKMYERDMEFAFLDSSPIKYGDFLRITNIEFTEEIAYAIRRAKDINDFSEKMQKLAEKTINPVFRYLDSLGL